MFLKKVLVHQTRHERMCNDGTKLSINGTYSTATGAPQATTEYDAYDRTTKVNMYLIGKDPRHGGSTGTQDGNIELENQIKEREHESIRNFKEK